MATTTKKKFPFAELRQLALRLPEGIQDFDVTQRPSAETLSGTGRLFLRAYGPLIEAHMDLSKVPAVFHETIKLAAAHSIHTILRTTTQAEATLAGVALPTFTRQKILTILRVYPRAMFLELFGFIPMNGPTARLHFKEYQYADALAGSTPAINPGDRTDDLTKFNKNYSSAPEGSMARKLKFQWKKLDIAVQDERILGEWSEQLADDAAANYDDDAEASHMDECVRMLSWIIQRYLIDAAVTAVPAANKATFDCAPANYNNLSPSEQTAYDQKLYTHGIVEVLELVRTTNKFNPTVGDPNWALCGTAVAKRLRRIKGFTSVSRDAAELAIQTGTIRDMGTLDDYGIRVLVDPQLTSTKMLFGRKPVNRGDAAIYLGMYVPLQMTKELYDPNTGFTTKGVRSRFAIADPDTSAEPASAELARSYGELTASNA